MCELSKWIKYVIKSRFSMKFDEDVNVEIGELLMLPMKPGFNESILIVRSYCDRHSDY